jgi:hypothetical protein
MVEYAQQVPLLFWFFTGVIAFSFTVVNWYSGSFGATRGWANADPASRPSERIINNFFILKYLNATNIMKFGKNWLTLTNFRLRQLL